MSPQPKPPARANSPGILHPDLALSIRQVPIAEIKAYERNPRAHSRSQLEKLEDSVRQFGFVCPVILDRDGTVIAGHARLKAAIALGYTHIPAVYLQHLNQMEVRALRLADNRLAELATWDESFLALELKVLLDIDRKLDLTFDLRITGFETAQIDRVVERAGEPADSATDDRVGDPDPDAEPVSRVGDHWMLGEHGLMCGDARDAQSYRTLLGDERAAAGIHDFPYNVRINGHVSGSRRHHEFVMAAGELGRPGFRSFLTDSLTQVKEASRPGAIQFGFMDWRHASDILAAGEASGLELKNLCVWDKGVGGMGSLYRSQHELVFVFKDPRAAHQNNVELGRHGRNRTNVWAYSGGAAAMKKELELHSTPKPVALVADAIRDCTGRGDIVLDAFCGSGTTIIAAAKTGRRARAIDLDPRYVDVALRRWEQWAGEVARHSGTGMTFEELRHHRKDASQTGGEAAPKIRVRQRPRPVQQGRA